MPQNGSVGITSQQFKQLSDRVEKKRRGPALPAELGPESNPLPHTVILGVDPSLRGTGYGVIRVAKPFPQTLVHGTVSCPADWEHSRCLVKTGGVLRDIIREHQPTLCIIEGLFFAQNLKTALIMGEARGAALMVIAEAGLEIYEVAPRKVKQAIVGYGAASKIAVAKMVQRMLQLAELPAPDAADALALALTHTQAAGRYSFNQPVRV